MRNDKDLKRCHDFVVELISDVLAPQNPALTSPAQQ